MIDYENFRMSLQRLKKQYANRDHLDPSLPEYIREGLAESVIQGFEVCYDCLWKVLTRYLADELAIPQVPNSPKPVFRLACENDLFAGPVEDWMDYAQRRADTSGDYTLRRRKRAWRSRKTSLMTPPASTRP